MVGRRGEGELHGSAGRLGELEKGTGRLVKLGGHRGQLVLGQGRGWVRAWISRRDSAGLLKGLELVGCSIGGQDCVVCSMGAMGDVSATGKDVVCW